jgi:hypothetical protein
MGQEIFFGSMHGLIIIQLQILEMIQSIKIIKVSALGVFPFFNRPHHPVHRQKLKKVGKFPGRKYLKDHQTPSLSGQYAESKCWR